MTDSPLGGLTYSAATGWSYGTLIQYAATAAAPTYVEGTNNPFSGDLAGRVRMLATLAAGSAIIGSVSINQTTPGTTNGVVVNGLPTIVEKQPAITVTAGAYVTGNVVGGLLTLTSAVASAGGQAWVQSAIAAFKSGVVPALDIILFNDNPTASTFTDNAAIAINTADLGKVRGVIHVSDYTLGAAATMSIGQAQNQGEPIVLVGTSLYVVVVARASATLGSTSDLILTMTLARN